MVFTKIIRIGNVSVCFRNKMKYYVRGVNGTTEKAFEELPKSDVILLIYEKISKDDKEYAEFNFQGDIDSEPYGRFVNDSNYCYINATFQVKTG